MDEDASEKLPYRAVIALGANLGMRDRALREALARLDELPTVEVGRVSGFIETDAVGGPPGQRKYINAAAILNTSLSPRELLTVLLDIEHELGRVRAKDQRNEPRTIDLDLLLYDQQIVREPGLEVPHPRLHERHFVLLPLSEIAPDWGHPVFKKSMRELLMALVPA
jgi:2-amino-4-hydroxy-6-hydroxymethyldihydropteridine diphosphokinase